MSAALISLSRSLKLPEYYPTRTERAIFEKHGSELPLYLVSPVTIAELGAGSASKTGVLLREFAANQPGLLYQPIDISPSALELAAQDLTQRIAGLRVEPTVANYITEPYAIQRPAHHKVLALYIGSSIGNFSPAEATGILRNLRTRLQTGDSLLLGLDLAPGPKKSVQDLIAAYDDAQGVTAAFNKNVLTRLNRDLGTTFDPDCFAHSARWNSTASRIEMHLESLASQSVNIESRTIHFAKGETIHTENSHKFTEASLRTLLDSAGFEIGLLLKDEHERFAVSLSSAN